MQAFNMPFIRHLSPQLAVAGQPSEAELAAARAAGLQRVINTRPLSEDAGFDEAATAVRMGLVYHCLPIASAQDLTLDAVRRFDQLLTEAKDASLLVHCASANRVGALFALRAAWLQGLSAEAALELGRQHGMTKLEVAVQALLQRGAV